MITQEDAIRLFRYNNKHIDELSNEDRLQIADWIDKRAKAWIIDHHIPVFVGDGRLYINALVYTESED